MVLSGHDIPDVHMIPEQFCLPPQDLQQIKPGWNGGVATGKLPIPKWSTPYLCAYR